MKPHVMSKKPVVIFDLDSTLNNLHEVISNSFKQYLKQDMPWYMWTNYHLTQTYGIQKSALIAHIEKYDLLQRSIPLPGANELVIKLKSKYTIGILTARADIQKATLNTYKWLLQHKIIPHWVKIVSYDKVGFIKSRVGQCDFYLDDCPQHLISVLESGTAKNVGTLDYAWSRNLPREILRFKNLDEVHSYLDKQIVN